jgi:hypothetical protein
MHLEFGGNNKHYTNMQVHIELSGDKHDTNNRRIFHPSKYRNAFHPVSDEILSTQDPEK